MKKILIVINTMGHAGAEVALLRLLEQFEPDKYDVSLYVLMGQGELIDRLPPHVTLLNKHYSVKRVLGREGRVDLRKTVIKSLLKNGCVIKLFPYMLRNYIQMVAKGQIQADKLLWRAVSESAEHFENEYDLAIAYLEGGSTYYVSDYVKAKKKVAFVHIDYEMSGYTRDLDKNCYDCFERIFTVSAEVQEIFNRVYPEHKGKTEIFHNILDKEYIQKRALQGKGFQDEYDGVRILSIGRLTRQKAFEMSIDAMRCLIDRGVPVRWYVLGDGDQRRFLEEKIADLRLKEKFLLLGQVDNPFPYLKEADIYVHASRFEGKSLAIQEAQILGKPIVVSDCSGNREQVVHEVDGLLCDFNEKSIADAVQRLINNPVERDKFAKAAALKNNDQFDEMRKIYNLLEG